MLDLGREMTRMTLSIIGKVLFDADIVAEADELDAAVRVAMGYVSLAINLPIALPVEWPVPGYRRIREAIACVRARVQQMIAERRASPGGLAEARDDLLSLLLRANDEDQAA